MTDKLRIGFTSFPIPYILIILEARKYKCTDQPPISGLQLDSTKTDFEDQLDFNNRFGFFLRLKFNRQLDEMMVCGISSWFLNIEK